MQDPLDNMLQQLYNPDSSTQCHQLKIYQLLRLQSGKLQVDRQRHQYDRYNKLRV